MDISKDAVKCSECTNNLEVFFKFQSACDYMGEVTLPTDLKEDIKFSPEKIEIASNLISPTESKHEVKCCFCTKTSGREFLVLLNESKEHKFLVDVLKEHIPKLNLNITEELLTCDTCINVLQDVFSFVMQCLEVEQKINKYTEIKGTNDEGHIELKDVQQFIYEPTVKFEIESVDVKELGERWDEFQEGCTMQAEAEAEIKFEKEIEDPELFIKREVDIKSEDSDCDSFQEPSRRHKECVNQHELTDKSSERKTVYKCEICPYEAKRNYYLERHKLTHKSTSEITMFKCEVCPYETRCRYNLKSHGLIHKSTSELTMFKCELCPYETKRRGHLKQHTLTHKSSSEVTMFKCVVCPYETKRQNNLQKHTLAHKRTSKVLKCELCPYVTKFWYLLKRHKLTHKVTVDLTMFKCDVCPYEAKRSYHLKRHKLMHKSSSDVTMFKCELCRYKTKRQDNLKSHTLTHKSASEVTMFKCEKCPYMAKRRDHLKKHQLTHKPKQ